MLKSLTVRGFKSIRELESFELGRLNVLIGANGSGKSNFISLFDMLAAVVGRRLRLFVAQNGGPDTLLFGGREGSSQIDVELMFGENGYEFSLVPEMSHMVFADESTRVINGWSSSRRHLGMGHNEALLPGIVTDTAAVYMTSAMRKWRYYHLHDTGTRSPIWYPQSVIDNLVLKSDGSNLAPFLRRLCEQYPHSYNSVLQTVRMGAPFLSDFVYRDNPGDRVGLEWLDVDDLDTPHQPIQLSDGTLRFVCLVTALLQPPDLLPKIILIDEPELGLHPHNITLLCELIKVVSSTSQIVLSTQSVDVINEFSPEDIVILDRHNGASSFTRPEPDSLSDWLEHYSLGELWIMNILEGRPWS